MKKRSSMFIVYLARMIGRGAVLLGAVYLYFFRRELLVSLVKPCFFTSGFGLPQAVWIFLMLGMVLHLLPRVRITMSGLKSRPYTYAAPEESYAVGDLYQFVQTMNLKAWTVMLLWLCFNAVFAVLYLLGVLTEAEMLLLTALYYLSDLLCMLVFCPFQALIMKNRCCVNCRIFDWGHFMIYTPMLFIKSFFSWSLFFTACVVLLRWEIVYAGHPERFWNGSNTAIRCENCTDKMCHIKRPLQDIYRSIRLMTIDAFTNERRDPHGPH